MSNFATSGLVIMHGTNMINTSYEPIRREFYLQNDTVLIAKQLLGKVLYTFINGNTTAGIITETEAYTGINDRASHAWNGRRTARTETMFCDGGIAYIYLCYGIHSLFNIVTSVKNVPNAVLIRGIEPVQGIEIMRLRAAKNVLSQKSGMGPGNVSRLLGIHFSLSGTDLCEIPTSAQKGFIWLQDEGIEVDEREVFAGPRIGVSYAGEDAFLPYRFVWKKGK